MHILLGALTADTPLIITEGFATAATLVEATGLPTVAAFDAGNLLAVAETYRMRNVGRPIIILAGDNDHHLPLITRADGTTLPNVGREKAEAAALAVNGLALIPPFAAGARGTDWNDYAALHGLDAVRRAVAEPLAGHGITLHPTPRETYMASRPPARAVQREAARRLAWRPPRAI
ncbi:MAG TPA: toprim domain-containing protein [Acetobacteraceae bacterium]|nr:toprim domain-containing protein [Acetobacteraceae bacterium]